MNRLSVDDRIRGAAARLAPAREFARLVGAGMQFGRAAGVGGGARRIGAATEHTKDASSRAATSDRLSSVGRASAPAMARARHLLWNAQRLMETVGSSLSRKHVSRHTDAASASMRALLSRTPTTALGAMNPKIKAIGGRPLHKLTRVSAAAQEVVWRAKTPAPLAMAAAGLPHGIAAPRRVGTPALLTEALRVSASAPVAGALTRKGSARLAALQMPAAAGRRLVSRAADRDSALLRSLANARVHGPANHGPVTINSAPTITIRSDRSRRSEPPDDLERRVEKELEKHAERIYEMVLRVATYRERVQY